MGWGHQEAHWSPAEYSWSKISRQISFWYGLDRWLELIGFLSPKTGWGKGRGVREKPTLYEIKGRWAAVGSIPALSIGAAWFEQWCGPRGNRNVNKHQPKKGRWALMSLPEGVSECKSSWSSLSDQMRTRIGAGARKWENSVRRNLRKYCVYWYTIP